MVINLWYTKSFLPCVYVCFNSCNAKRMKLFLLIWKSNCFIFKYNEKLLAGVQFSCYFLRTIQIIQTIQWWQEIRKGDAAVHDQCLDPELGSWVPPKKKKTLKNTVLPFCICIIPANTVHIIIIIIITMVIIPFLPDCFPCFINRQMSFVIPSLPVVPLPRFYFKHPSCSGGIFVVWQHKYEQSKSERLFLL